MNAAIGGSANLPKKERTLPLDSGCKIPCTIGNLFKNISLAVLLNLFVKVAWIFANNIFQDRVGHEAFGLFLALYSLGFLFLVLADMGIAQYATVTLAQQPELLRRLFPDLLGLKIFLSGIYPFFMVGVGWLLGYESQELYLLFLLCAVQGILQVNAFFRANFQAFQQFGMDAVASVLDRAVMLVIVVVMLLTRVTLESYVWAYLISAVVAMGLMYGAIGRLHGWMLPRLSRMQAGKMLKASFPFAVITILYSLNDKIDQVMLERILGGETGKHETGLYGGAYRWVDTSMMYLWTILPIFFAKFAKARHRPEELNKLLRFGQPLAALPMIFAAGFVFFHGEKLLFLFQNSTSAELSTMQDTLKILFLAVLVNGICAIYSTLLTSTGHERFVSIMIGVSILLNVTLNSIFIPQYGAYACAWATVTSFSFLSLSYIVYIHFKLEAGLPWVPLAKLCLLTLLYGSAYHFLELSSLPWWLTSTLAGCVLLVLALILRLIPLRNEH
jgi:O-antigen/teichoic acid export membrane protein